MSRPLVTALPDTGAIANSYDDTNLIITISRSKDASNLLYGRKHFNSLGLSSEDEICEDGTAACAQSIKTDYTCDAEFRLATATNP
jgi:hypothetical protein